MDERRPPSHQGSNGNTRPSVRRKQTDANASSRRGRRPPSTNASVRDDVFRWTYRGNYSRAMMDFIKKNPEHYGKLEHEMRSHAVIEIEGDSIILKKNQEQEPGSWKKDCQIKLQDFFKTYTVRTQSVEIFHKSMLGDPNTHAKYWRDGNFTTIAVAGLVRDVNRRVQALKQEVRILGQQRTPSSEIFHETVSVQPFQHNRLPPNIIQRISSNCNATVFFTSPTHINISGNRQAVENARQCVLDEVFRTAVKSYPCPFWVFEWISSHIDEAFHHFPEIQISHDAGKVNIVGHPSEVNPVYGKLTSEIAAYNEAKISVPKEYHGRVIGKKGQKCMELQNKHQVSVIVPPGNSDDTDIIVCGLRNHVQAAKAEIETLVAGVVKNEEKSTLLVRIQPSHRLRIKNDLLQSIKSDIGVDSKWLSSGNILLTGPRDKLKQAEDSVIFELQSTETKLLEVPSWLMPYLAPFKTEGKKKWPEITLTNTENGLSLTGHHTEVTPFHDDLSKNVERLKETKCRRTMKVRREFHGAVIGKKGQTIKHLQRKYNVELEIPKDGECRDDITLQGDKESVEAAEKEILELIGKLENSASKTVQVQHQVERYIPSCIKELQKQFSEIKIDGAQRSVTLVGNRERVDQASAFLRKKLDSLKNAIKTVAIPMTDRQLLGIIGWKHCQLKELRTGYQDIRIYYNEHPAKVIIEGEKEKVEKAHIDIVKKLPDLADFHIAEVKIEMMGKFIGRGGSNLTRWKEYYCNVKIETPRKERPNDPIVIIGKKRYVDEFCGFLYQYNTQWVKNHTKVLRKSSVGSMSPEKRQMYGSHSSLSSCLSSNYGEQNDSDESTGCYQEDEATPSCKAVLHTQKIRAGLKRFLLHSEKHMQNLRALFTESSLTLSEDAICIAGQVATDQEQYWNWKIRLALVDFIDQFADFVTTFPPLSSVERQNHLDDDMIIIWDEDGGVIVSGLKSKVEEKRREFEEIKQRKRRLSHSWPCDNVHFLHFLRESSAECQNLEASVRDLGCITINDGDITMSNDVLETVTKDEWVGDCERRLKSYFSEFAIEKIDIPISLAGDMRDYCEFHPKVTVAWAENSSVLVYGKNSEVTRKVNFLKKKLDELKSRKKKVLHTWSCEDENVFNFVRESVKQMEGFAKFLGEIGSPALSDHIVTVRSEILQTQSASEWEVKCRAKVIEFFNRFGTQYIDVTEAQSRHAEAEVETRSSVITKWIPEESRLQICGVKADVNLKIVLIKKKMERLENLTRWEMLQSSVPIEMNVNFHQEGPPELGEFSLTIKLMETKLKCVIASQKESELCMVRIETEGDRVKISGKKQDILIAKGFIDSVVADEFEVKKYGAFEFLSDSTIGLQIQHIGIKHNCTILEEQIVDSNWGDRRFICLPAEIDQATIFGSLSVTVEEGDITCDNSDMIVNTSDKSFSFSGPLSKAILAKGGDKLRHEFQSIGRLDNETGITSGGNLKCKMILHVAIPASHESMEALVLKILTAANNVQMKSITLPTIGAGGGGWNSRDVAVGMRRGIANFAKRNPDPSCLKHVKVMLLPTVSTSHKQPFYDQLMKADAKQESRRRSNTESQPSIVQRFFSLFSRQPQPAATATEKPTEQNDENANRKGEKPLETKKTDRGEFAKIIISSNNEQSVKEAKKEVEKFVGRNLKEFVLDKAEIIKLKQSHLDKMRKIAEEQKVRIVVNRENQNHFVTIQGVDEYASPAKEEIQKIISGLSSDLPESWCDMPDGQKVMRVNLASDSEEYRKVERRFTEANVRQYRNYSVSRIERIQNPTLYRQYQSKKAEIEARSSTSGKIDRKLFHGTDSDTVEKICNDVFNRSYAGKNATAYGKGVYFSTQSSYSDSYAPSNYMGIKQMFLASVLTGDYCEGKSSMLDPPRNPRTGEVYDSLVDNVNNPSIFVVFRDWSVYPLYIISYHHT